MTGEIARELAEPFRDTTDDFAVFDQIVQLAARSRAKQAAERAREAEVEAVICVEEAGLSVREGAQILGVSPQKATRMRKSYITGAGLVPPEVPDMVLGRQLQAANWPETEPTIRAALEGMAWHSIHQA